MRRILIGTGLVVHGLMHSALGIWSAGFGQGWLSTPLWLTAQVGFLIAGFGVLGVPWCRRVWMPSAVLAALASLLMYALYPHGALTWGVPIDVAVVLFGTQWTPTSTAWGHGVHAGHPGWRAAASVMATLFVLYNAVVIASRPWYMGWGTSADERTAHLPGDDRTPLANYRSDRAVRIRAPADAVWPWLVQIGQDRAGFYSYDRLERFIGDDIHNADSVHPEWQVVQAGDLVRATQPDYLGGRFGRDLGWRVAEVVPGRAIVLDGWGAFVLRPVDSATTVLQVRTRGEGTPTVRGTLVSPLALLMLEPAHFIMERRMLLGIRERAEHRK